MRTISKNKVYDFLSHFNSFTFLIILLFTNTVYADANPSDSCANPRAITVPGSDTGYLVGNGSSPYEEDFYVFTASGNGEIHIWSTGYNDDLDAFLYDDNSCNNRVASDTRGSNQTNNVDFTYNVIGGRTYKLKIRGWRGDAAYVVNIALTKTGTNWVKNGAGDSAYTDPSPYTDNVNVTETLSLSGASSVVVTVSGEIENHPSCDYDYVQVTDANGNSQKFCGNISETYTAAGPDVTIFFHSDGSEVRSGVTVTLTSLETAAVDDSYSTNVDTTLTVNATDGVLSNDTGSGLTVTSIPITPQPTNGTVTMNSDGSFTYEPDSGFTGADSFQYTITDASNVTATATVQITVSASTDYTNVFGFELINPANTRNIRGDYVIGGNTVLCLTTKRDGYADSSDACYDANTGLTEDATSNNYVAKFINIDGAADTSLWNSSSSYVNLPETYDQKGGKGILWAGLFWQGRFAWYGGVNRGWSNVEKLRYGVQSGSTFNWVETGDNTSVSGVSLEDAGAKNIKLKVDNGSYQLQTATKVYYDSSSAGITYAAFANVTKQLQDANLAKGDHTFTVGNLPTSEGREHSPGILGGWSIVVIYAEDFNGQPRNVSVYNGLDSLDESNTPIEISGFKLPSAGNTVTAQLSIFSGEGEKPYSDDWVRISDTTHSGTSGWDELSGASDPDNMFDGIMDGITRENVTGHSNNLQNNNVGVEVDRFDVSNLVSGYSRDITSLFIKWWSENDYVTPSMMVFSTELYKPNICYEYTFDIGGYQLESINNEINTSFHLSNNELSTHVAIRSLEGDFDLTNTRFTVISDEEYMSYQSGSAALAPNAILGYTSVPVFGVDDPSPSSFTMNIGEGSGVGAGNGGVISAYQTTYVRFSHEMETSKSIINTILDMRVEYEVDYGSGGVPQVSFLTETCGGGGAYLPTYGSFNVERRTPTNVTAVNTDFNLYTQVSGREFELNLVAYEDDSNYTRKTFNEDITVEIEVVNANILGADADVQCNNADNNDTVPVFAVIPANSMSVPLLNQQFDIAKRNAAYRVWNLKAEDGSLQKHTCADANDQSCFETLYTGNYTNDDYCSTSCGGGGGSCYACLRKYYGQVTCSRDNFSVRPASYKIALIDVNNSVTVGINDTTIPYRVTAGYGYAYEVNATSFGSSTLAAGYRQGFADESWDSFDVNEETDRGAYMLNQAQIDNNTACNDLDHKKYGFSFWDGKSNNQVIGVQNVGDYKLHFLDNEWTAVDQVGRANVLIGTGCIENTNLIPAVTPSIDKVGCNVNSEYNATRRDLHIRAYPDNFSLGTVVLSTPDANNTFIYSNTLNFGGSFDNNMSVNFIGQVTARGATNAPLSNFVTGCYAQDLNLTLDSNTTPAIPRDVSGTAVRFKWLENEASGGSYTEYFDTNISTWLVERKFSKLLAGQTQLRYYVNYDRPSNSVMNPFALTVEKLKVNCKNSGCRAYANGNASYDPVGEATYNNNLTVAYGRVNAPRRRVMCADASSSCVGSMDYYYEIYADKNANQALLTQLLGSNPQRSLDSVNWYRNTKHTATSGEVATTVQSAYITPGSVTTVNGVTTIPYTYTGGRGYPYKDSIKLNNGVGIEPWLIYDKYNANATQTSAELEYYGPGKWTSSGSNTTHSAPAGTQKKTNRRIQW